MMEEFKVGDIVEWNEKEAAGTGLDHVKGKIIEEDGRKSILVREWEDDGTDLGKSAVGYSLTEKRIAAIKKWRKSR